MTTWAWFFIPPALLVGALISWVVASVRLGRERAAAAVLAARVSGFEAQLGKAENLLEEERKKNLALSVSLAGVESEKLHLLERLENEARRLSDMQAQMKLEFENLAGRLLEEKSSKFLDQNQQHLAALLAPFRERLGEFRERMEIIHNEEEKSTAALGSHLKSLHDLNRQMAEEAGNLTAALKGQAKSQGIWGELVLERILEKSGLTKGAEYETQASFQDDEGNRRMPDVVIHLPEGKTLIIDAKVSLTAYEKAANAPAESARAAALREHVFSLRRHVEELAKKDYPALRNLQAPDFVLMFVPVEPALHLALQEDPSLYGDAFEKSVVLVSSSTLLVALRAVQSVWRYQKQTVNAQEIARQAGNLHDSFVLFTQSLEEIGARLDQAKAVYDQTLSRLVTGRGNLVRRTLELQKLGVRGDKQLSATVSKLAEE